MFSQKCEIKRLAACGVAAEVEKVHARERTSFLRGFGAVVIVVALMAALMACGCSSSTDSESAASEKPSAGEASEEPSAGEASDAPESLFQVARLYAMNPQDIGPFMESQGYTFISEDDFFAASNMTRDEVFSPEAGPEYNESVGMFCSVWWPSLISDMISNPDAYGDVSVQDALESAEYKDGYTAYVFFNKEGYNDPDHMQEAFEKYGPTWDVLDRMDAADLSKGQKPGSVDVMMYDLNHYGQYLSADGENSYTNARARALELADLPEPQATCAYADANGSVTSYAWGLCDAGGVECIYTVINSGHSEVRISIEPVDTAMARQGADSPEDLIEAIAAGRKQGLENRMAQGLVEVEILE